jgi:hypothetical protein
MTYNIIPKTQLKPIYELFLFFGECVLKKAQQRWHAEQQGNHFQDFLDLTGSAVNWTWKTLRPISLRRLIMTT